MFFPGSPGPRTKKLRARPGPQSGTFPPASSPRVAARAGAVANRPRNGGGSDDESSVCSTYWRGSRMRVTFSPRHGREGTRSSSGSLIGGERWGLAAAETRGTRVRSRNSSSEGCLGTPARALPAASKHASCAPCVRMIFPRVPRGFLVIRVR